MTAHEIQLAAYAYLFRSVTGERESELQIRSLIKTKTPKVATHQYQARTDEHFRRLFALIREYLDALERGVFNYRPSWSCGSCDFREQHCHQWSG
jgi:CRISPR/Cas system-associated exonuclease Cas4 (RecB family)